MTYGKVILFQTLKLSDQHCSFLLNTIKESVKISNAIKSKLIIYKFSNTIDSHNAHSYSCPHISTTGKHYFQMVYTRKCMAYQGPLGLKHFVTIRHLFKK